MVSRQAALLMERVEQHVEPDPRGVFARVAFALQRFVVFQRAAKVEGRKDHCVAVAQFQAFEVWFSGAGLGLSPGLSPANNMML